MRHRTTAPETDGRNKKKKRTISYKTRRASNLLSILCVFCCFRYINPTFVPPHPLYVRRWHQPWVIRRSFEFEARLPNDLTHQCTTFNVQTESRFVRCRLSKLMFRPTQLHSKATEKERKKEMKKKERKMNEMRRNKSKTVSTSRSFSSVGVWTELR